MFGAGWLLDRRCRLDLGSLVKMNIYLFVPAFIFVQIVRSNLTAVLALRVVGFTVAIFAGMFVLGALVGRVMGYPRPQTRSLQLSTMFYNSGNYGVPLMALAFPAHGPVLQVFIIVATNVIDTIPRVRGTLGDGSLHNRHDKRKNTTHAVSTTSSVNPAQRTTARF